MAEPLRAYVIADIEGSTGVWSRDDTLTGNSGWQKARLEMSKDVTVITESLFSSGAESVMVKDFHRDGYNLLPGLVDRRAELIRGYYLKPVIMYGDLKKSNRAFLTGMHASSGSKKGFLAHTLTSRISELKIGGKRISETQLFSHVLGNAGIPVVFVSGCPAACEEALDSLPWLITCPVPKEPVFSSDPQYAHKIRFLLKEKVKEASQIHDPPLYRIKPPYECQIIFTNPNAARKHNRWGFPQEGPMIFFKTEDPNDMILKIIKIAYFSPVSFRLLPILLPAVRYFLSIAEIFR